VEGIYAFYHPTFQEYFAALALEDWHFLLNHIPGNPQHPDARYQIFEKHWKEVVLLWLGREEVGKEEKEAFIKALVKFEDGCGDFYKYRAYFLAAAGIVEFKDCSLGDEIVSQIVKWGFGYFIEEKQEWRKKFNPIAERAREVLKETYQEKTISALVELIGTSQKGDIQEKATYSLGKIGQNHPEAISALVELIGTSQNEYTRCRVADSLVGKIHKDHQVASENLVKLIDLSQDKYTRWLAVRSLGEIGKDNKVASEALVELIGTSQDGNILWRESYSLGKIDQDNQVTSEALVKVIGTYEDKNTLLNLVARVSGLKDCVTSEIYENDFDHLIYRYRVIWECAQNMTYPEFYQAWHTQPTN
jgi:hypothetical protein